MVLESNTRPRAATGDTDDTDKGRMDTETGSFLLECAMRRIFINDFGRLRSGWRVLLFILAFLVIYYPLAALGWIVYLAVREAGPWSARLSFVPDLTFRCTLVICALGGGYLCARLFEGLPWRSLGLSLHQGWLRDLLIGCAIGFVSLAVAVGIAAAAGGLQFSFTPAILPLVKSLVGSLVVLFIAALAEEATFRGYPLQTLARAKLAWLGVVLTLALFGYVHLANPNATPLATFTNTSLAGLMLALAYLRTRSLWLPLGIHWAWNWALGWFFGLPVSGMNLFSHPLFNATDVGPAWITGGSYGIEGGIACTISMAIFTLYIWRTRLVSATPELQQLTSEENPLTRRSVVNSRPANETA
jgi:CAAX protease family protein